MKKTLLILSFIALSFNANAQVFKTGNISFNSNFSADITINATTTTLLLTAPSNVWFAVGFGGASMSSGADIFRSNGTEITDAKTSGRFLPTADAQQDWALQSNTVSGGIRTMIVTRANNTGDSNDFEFSPSTGGLTLMWAHGSSTNYAYHGGNRGSTAVQVLSTPEANRLDFDVYPNPASETITIQLPSEENKATVQFYNYIGKLAFTKNVTTTNNNIDVNNLASGVYLLKVIAGSSIGSQKFIKK